MKYSKTQAIYPSATDDKPLKTDILDISPHRVYLVSLQHYLYLLSVALVLIRLLEPTGVTRYASSGSTPITSVDADFGCVKFIKQVAAEYDFNIAATKSDVFTFLERNKATYDIIFADPPYALDQKTFDKIVLLVFEKNTLQEDGMMIIEHSKYTKLDHLIHFSFKKSYGGSIFSFFEIGKSTDEEIDDEELFSDSEEE